ncbi:hypothetical protein ACA910_017479 [Epithemia clementina (nom. ined.)]
MASSGTKKEGVVTDTCPGELQCLNGGECQEARATGTFVCDCSMAFDINDNLDDESGGGGGGSDWIQRYVGTSCQVGAQKDDYCVSVNGHLVDKGLFCVNGGTCRSDTTADDFHAQPCTCHHNFTGKHCEYAPGETGAGPIGQGQNTTLSSSGGGGEGGHHSEPVPLPQTPNGGHDGGDPVDPKTKESAFVPPNREDPPSSKGPQGGGEGHDMANSSSSQATETSAAAAQVDDEIDGHFSVAGLTTLSFTLVIFILIGLYCFIRCRRRFRHYQFNSQAAKAAAVSAAAMGAAAVAATANAEKDVASTTSSSSPEDEEHGSFEEMDMEDVDDDEEEQIGGGGGGGYHDEVVISFYDDCNVQSSTHSISAPLTATTEAIGHFN